MLNVKHVSQAIVVANLLFWFEAQVLQSLGRCHCFQIERKTVGHIGAASTANKSVSCVTTPCVPHDKWRAQLSVAQHAYIVLSRPPNVIVVVPDHHSRFS
jgi:hypothetical protein